MNNKIEIFKHEKFGEVRTMLIDGEPWFVGKDIATMLGYKDSINALKSHVDDDDRMGWRITTPSRGTQNISIINESGMYSLILSSKLPAAKEFKRWVTSEVLPTIRKHGVYATDDMLEKILFNPDAAIKVFTALKKERDMRKKLEAENMELSKQADYLKLITKCPNAIPVSDIAKDYGMSAIELNNLLHFFHVQYKMKCGTWLLYQKYTGLGYTVSKTFVYDEVNCGSAIHTYWTQKGRRFLYEFLKEKGVLPDCEKEGVCLCS